jgi:hypothetical protein
MHGIRKHEHWKRSTTSTMNILSSVLPPFEEGIAATSYSRGQMEIASAMSGKAPRIRALIERPYAKPLSS